MKHNYKNILPWTMVSAVSSSYLPALECLLFKEGKHPIFLPQQVMQHLQQQEPVVWQQLLPSILSHTQQHWPPTEHHKLKQLLLQFIGARMLKEPEALHSMQWKHLLLTASQNDVALLFDPLLFPPLLWCASELGFEQLLEDLLKLGGHWEQHIEFPIHQQIKTMSVASVIVSLGSAQAMYALGKYGHQLLEPSGIGFIDKQLGLTLLKRHNSQTLFQSYQRGYEYFILNQVTKEGKKQSEGRKIL